MEETKIFSGGGMDSNTALEGVTNNDYLDAELVRTGTTGGNDAGYLVAMEGNTLRSNPNHSSGDVLRKAEYFPEIGRVILFFYNGTNQRIDEFDPITLNFNTLIQGGNILSTRYVKDIKLVAKKFLVWNDTRSEIRCINIERARSGEYTVFSDTDISLAKQPPILAPTASYRSQGTQNLIRGNLYQFRVKYVYKDGYESAWGPASERPVPVEEGDPDFSGQDENNVIIVGTTYGDDTVEEVITAARAGDGDWFIIDKMKRSDILALSLLPFPPPTNLPDKYKNNIGWYYFQFKNNSIYESVDVLETDLLHDYIPRQAKALEVLNKNVVALGSTLEGYERPTGIEPNIWTSVEPIIDENSGTSFTIDSIWTTYPEPYMARTFLQFTGDDFSAGDTVTANFIGRNGAGRIYETQSISYQFTTGDAATPNTGLNNMLNYFSSQLSIPYSGNLYGYNIFENSTGWRVEFNVAVPLNDRYVTVNQVDVTYSTISGDIRSIPSLKKRSGYQAALAYYDKYGRAFPIITGDTFKIETPDAPFNSKVVLNWSLAGQVPPEGAASYGWLLTENLRYENWVDTGAAYVSAESDSETAVFNITVLSEFSKQNEGSPIVYDYTEGDRAVLYNTVSTVDVRVKKVEVEGDNLMLYTEVPQGYTLSSVIYAQLYTPKKYGQVANNETMVFYEVGENYPIVDGEHVVESGTIEWADNYIKRRIMTSSTTTANIITESPHFSDYYISNYYSYGRPRTYYDTPENYLAQARIRYSRDYIKGNRVDINGISRFYGENYEDYDDIYGTICYLANRQNRLICLQEQNIGYIGVYRSIIEDSVGQQNIAVSEKLLSEIEYTRGEATGIGDALDSFTNYNGVLYFVDPHKERVVRAGTDGVINIGYKFSEKLQQELKTSKHNGETGSVKGYFNNQYGEYSLYIPHLNIMYIFNEFVDKWVCRAPYITQFSFSSDNKYYSAQDGQIWEHTLDSVRANYFGTQYTPSVTAVVNVDTGRIKTYQSLAVHSDKLIFTEDDGINTQLGHVSDLIETDFSTREGVHYANFLRDKNTGNLANGDRLKGRWVTLKLIPSEPDFKLLKIVVKSSVSTPNE